MSRMETTMAVGSSIAASLFSHVFCCGLLPFALNASASVFLGGLGMQVGFAIVTILAVAGGVTMLEKHRHATACSHDSCAHHVHAFDFHRHFLRNLLVGVCTYGFFYALTHLPAVHNVLDGVFHITH